MLFWNNLHEVNVKRLGSQIEDTYTETTKDKLELKRSHHAIFRSYFPLILTLKLRKIY
jgi:hypothetical protein